MAAGEPEAGVDPSAWGIYASEPNDATMAARVPRRIQVAWLTDTADVAKAAGCSKGEAAAVGVQILSGLKEQWIASAKRIKGRSAVAGDQATGTAAQPAEEIV